MSDHATHAGHASSLPPGVWVFPLVCIVIGTAYLVLAYRQRRRAKEWSMWRDVSFVSGIVLLAIAFSPTLSRLAHEDLRIHMVQHLVIGMLAPLGLALAAPVSLLLRTVSVPTGRRIAALLRFPPIHTLSHPVTALILNIGGMYMLYLTPLFAWSVNHPALHLLVNLHFLAAGYLFVWSIAGPDPSPGRPGFPFRVVVLVLSLGLHAFLGKLMYAHLYPRDAGFDADQTRRAAIMMYYGGDIAELLLAIALFSTWYAARRRSRNRVRSTTNEATRAIAA